MHLAPACAHFLEDHQGITVERAHGRKDFTHAVAVDVELVDKVYAGEKSFGRRLIGLKFRKVCAHPRSLRRRDQKEIALKFILRREREAANQFVLSIAIQVGRRQIRNFDGLRASSAS